MNYDIYLDLISQEKYVEATDYKSSCITDTLYKYYTLDDNEDINKLRLSTLERGEIYLSSLKQFNDPFEGKAFIFEDDDTAPKGFRKTDFQNYSNQMNKTVRICCFANPDEKYQNMPMWAYYASNHRGYCVEYNMNSWQKQFLYPVIYGPERTVGNVFMSNLIMGIVDMIRNKKDISQMSGDVSVYGYISYLSLTCKHVSWRHEKEVRALVPLDFGPYFMAKPSKIYIGMNCSPEHEQELLNIGKKFIGCQVYKMQEVTDESGFYLKEIQLL